MSIIALLHNLLKEKLPGIHATRLTALMAAVEAGLKCASVSITELGRTLSGPAYIKHKIKRMDRLAGNCHLNTERTAVYGAMTQWLLQSLPMPLILIDWSPLTADQHQQLLRAALPTGGRSVTLYEEIHPVKKTGQPPCTAAIPYQFASFATRQCNAYHCCRFRISHAIFSRS